MMFLYIAAVNRYSHILTLATVLESRSAKGIRGREMKRGERDGKGPGPANMI